MSTATLKRTRLRLGPYSAGILLRPAEFDRADFEEGWRYELIRRVLVVNPTPLEADELPPVVPLPEDAPAADQPQKG